MTPLLKRAAKPALFLLCLVPLAKLVLDGLTGHLEAEVIKDITHRTGFWGITLITVTLALTPLRRVTGWNGAGRYRRMLGLFGFFYIVLHFLIYLVLDQFFAWQEIVKDIAMRLFITVGFTGFALMIPLALTSTAKSVKRLGRKWVPLHSLIYVTALAGVVHFVWSQKADISLPTRYGVALIVLLALRLVPRSRLSAWSSSLFPNSGARSKPPSDRSSSSPAPEPARPSASSAESAI